MTGLESKKIQWGWGLALALLALASPSTNGAKEFNPDNPINPPPPIYWCPNRTPDQQIVTVPTPGCKPLVEEEKTGGKEQKTEAKEPIKIVEIQNEASKFVNRYRKFLDCCANDVGSLEDLEDLQEQASYILKSVQQKGIFNSAGQPSSGPAGTGGTLGTFARQWTLSEIVGTVARARDDLRKLKVRLERLGESMEKLDTLGSEAAGKTRARIEEEKEAIAREFRSRKPPESARTGMEIQDSNLPVRIGGDIEDTTLNKNFGVDIGYTVSPYSDVREDLRPRRGTDIQDTNLPSRIGPDTQDTTLPYSFGFEVEKKENPTGSSTTPSRVGPAVGDSSLNRRP
ncbi:MAG: hypothetical protein ACREI2_00165 [Nitrospiraceae bacterium]